jgi:hypothetical protein
MANVYTRQIFASAGVNGTFFSGPPPAGFIWILIAGDFYYNHVEGATVNLIGSGGQTFWHNNWGASLAPQYASWRGRVVIGTGKTCGVSSTGGTDVTVTAYELALP